MPVETNQAAVDAERNLQAYFLALFDRIFPPGYLVPIKSPGPGYELFQAFAKIGERLSLATAHTKVAGLTMTAAGPQRAQCTAKFTPGPSQATTYTIKAGTVVRASKGQRDFKLMSDVVYQPIFVGVGAAALGSNAVTSPDGVTWTQRSTSIGGASAVAYGLGLFVAITGSGVSTSPDGITWTNRSIAGATGLTSIAFGNGKFVALGAGDGNGFISTDGINWTRISLPAGVGGGSASFTFGGGKFVAVGQLTSASSTDGVTWTTGTLAAAGSSTSCVTWGNGLFVQCATSVCSISTDGVNWTAKTFPSANGLSPQAIGFGTIGGNGIFVAVGNSTGGTGFATFDGTTWTARTGVPALGAYRCIAFNGLVFAIAGQNAGFGGVSSDGINWTQTTIPCNATNQSILGMVSNIGGPVNGTVEAVAPGYEWNIPGPKTTLAGVTLPGEIDTLLTPVLDPPFADPLLTVSQLTDAIGGQDAALDQIGLDRSIPRSSGETDLAYAARINALPDTISPGAFARLLATLLAPFGVTASLFEMFDIRLQTVWDAPPAAIPANPNYAPNLFAYDDDFGRANPVPGGPAIFDRWLPDSHLGGLIIIPSIHLANTGMAYDDTANTTASFLHRAIGAWDVPSTLDFSEIQPAWDGQDFSASAVYTSIFNSVQAIRAAGVPVYVGLV